MLRVSYSNTPAGQRWHLCGRLAGSWVDEFRACWRNLRRQAPDTRAVLDLTEVTFIDEDGEELLSELQASGVEFVVSGVENKDLLQGLKQNDRRPVRRLVRNSTHPGGDE